ncbi:unnamed protein product [Prorocentrum cordatum]|uniref:Uncharacterized protein n=1 Tax=Prorocentrum cordatum TaxID=2364126 RepID=A0ABN9WIU0_9DINO|nr:unnamed protein product [Polarella glacialis]
MTAAVRLVRAAVAAAAAATVAGAPVEDAALVAQFEEYLREHGKRYAGAEWHERLSNFRESLRVIGEHAARPSSHRLHLNHLADLSPAEFARQQLGLRPGARRGRAAGRPRGGPGAPAAGASPARLGSSGAAPAASLDWRSRGKVNPPRQQGGCGACWTFASASALASAWGIASEQMVNVSEQQLLDCAGEEFGNTGCDGGEFDGTYEYASLSPLCTAESYPYRSRKFECGSRACEVGIPKGAVLGHMDVESGSEAALMDAVAKQPVTVGIQVQASGGLKLYQSGIFSGDCTSAVNHAVVVVGWGSEDGKDYWLIQNSWGLSWGEGGYFRLARGPGQDGSGECGILVMPSYPVVSLPGATTTAVETWDTTSEPALADTTAGEAWDTTSEPALADTTAGEAWDTTSEPALADTTAGEAWDTTSEPALADTTAGEAWDTTSGPALADTTADVLWDTTSEPALADTTQGFLI